ncbi:hypothetical protein [Spirosoma agri]
MSNVNRISAPISKSSQSGFRGLSLSGLNGSIRVDGGLADSGGE